MLASWKNELVALAALLVSVLVIWQIADKSYFKNAKLETSLTQYVTAYNQCMSQLPKPAKK